MISTTTGSDVALSPKERERQIVEAFERSISLALHSNDIAVKGKTVRDARTMKAAAEAYQLSDDAIRRIAHGAILCLHSLGKSLFETYGTNKPRGYAGTLGIPVGVCRNALSLAEFSEKAVREMLAQFARDGRLPGTQKLIDSLRNDDPRRKAERDETARRHREEHEAAENKRKSDPDYRAIKEIAREFGWDTWGHCKEILRLRRLLALASKR